VRRDSVTVPALDGRSLATSDVVLGLAGSGLAWVPRAAGDTGGGKADTVLLNPLGRFPSGSVAELYYEVYGFAPGATYHTEVRLERAGGRSLLGRIAGVFGGRRAPVLLEFDAPADGPVTRVHRGVSLRDVAPGSYVVTVTLRDPATDRRLSMRRALQVVSAAQR
jgi:hypothetical protein